MSRILLALSLMMFSLLTPGFVRTAQPGDFTLTDHPLSVLAAYYNAINAGDYARAYDYWQGNEPSGATLTQFAQGFASTRSIQALARLPLRYEGAAGSTYAEIPVLLRATLHNGDQQVYGGCFVTRAFNVPVGNAAEPDPNWHLYGATLSEFNALDFTRAVSACDNVESFPASAPLEVTTNPFDTLAAYYDAIGRGDYARAYGYWGGSAPNGLTLQEFSAGFAGTDNIGVVVDLAVRMEAAAGSAYIAIPTALFATQNGTPQFFVGCYVLRKSNVPVGNAAEPDPNWYLYQADVTEVNTAAAALETAGQACALG